MNKQGPGKIDWTDYTWNPISGCLHNCDYCYMKRMEKRFKGITVPAFHSERLENIYRIKKPSKIFVGSSGDMWGEWVPREWINEVLDIAALNDQHTFQFLTKNPAEYNHWDLFEMGNCWFGTTVDGTPKTSMNLATLLTAIPYSIVKFASFEPLLAPVNIEPIYMDMLDWIIIGADSTKGSNKPPKEWAGKLIERARAFNTPVWVKDNYGYPEIIKEFPGGLR